MTDADAGEGCPVPSTHDKFGEAHYFLDALLATIHEPLPFRWNLNAFLQALRSVPEMARYELRRQDGGLEWVNLQIDQLRADPLLERLTEGRNIVVHRGMLRRRSRVEAGIFRGRRLKLASQMELDVDIPSDVLLQRSVDQLVGFLIDAEHSAISEQIGVRRQWIVEEIGEDDVVELCHRGWAKVSEFVSRVHAFMGAHLDPIPAEATDEHDVERSNLLLETDLDPTLVERWGW